MKKLVAAIVVVLACLCIAQDSGDYPNGVRIVFGDGTSTQLSCTQDGNCRVVRNTATANLSQINLGFSSKHGYILKVQ